MQFNLKLILVLAGLLSSFAAANPNPQSPAQTTAAAEALKSYYLELETDTALLALYSSLSTDTAVLASVTAFEASISSQIAAQETLGPNYLDGLPSQVRPVFSSILSEEFAILSSNGFANRLPMTASTSTSTSQAAAPRETAVLKVAGAVAVGVVGALIAL